MSKPKPKTNASEGMSFIDAVMRLDAEAPANAYDRDARLAEAGFDVEGGKKRALAMIEAEKERRKRGGK